MEPHAPYPSKVIANEFIRLAQKNGGLTHLQIQKLVYFAHVESLGKHDKPLVRRLFRAWSFGPVDLEIYSEFRGSGKRKIKEEIRYVGDTIDESSKCLIKEVYKEYGDKTGWELSEMSHDTTSYLGHPWAEVYQKGETGILIPNEEIKKCYHEMKS